MEEPNDMPCIAICPKCEQEHRINVDPDISPVPYGCTIECGNCGTVFKVEKGITAN